MTKVRKTIQNQRLKNLIKELKQEKGIWKALGEELNKPNRRRAEVNLHKLNKEMENGEIALVPGKVLGYGKLDKDKKIKIASFNYSNKALQKIEKTKTEAHTIEEIKEQNPSKEKMRIIK